jgi:hypothetical protein
MNKLITVLAFAALCGPASAAALTQPASNATAATYATDAANNLPSQLGALQAEVKALEGQVQTMQSTNIAQTDVSTAELATIGTGG